MRSASWIGLAAAALCGCAASHQYFEPAERVQGQTVQGDKVAIYALTARGKNFGEAKIWSQGAYETDGGGNVVHVGIEVHNTGDVPIELRARELLLDIMDEDHGPVRGLRTADTSVRVIAPSAIADGNYLFALPPAVAPRNVVALRLHWRVHASDQTYAQRTPFVEEREGPYSPYYDYPCWPYGPYDCTYMHPYVGADVYRPVLVPRRVPVYRSPRTVVKPKR
jgi:hypothetical protein